MEHISVTQFRLVKNHPYLRAVIDLKTSGLQLRGLRLEQKERGQLVLGFPGRKIQGQWQTVFETDDPKSTESLLSYLEDHYNRMAASA